MRSADCKTLKIFRRSELVRHNRRPQAPAAAKPRSEQSRVSAGDAESFFDLRKRRVCVVVAEQIEEARLRRVAAFAFADNVGEAPRRGEPGFYADLAALALDGGILHADIGKPPTAFRGRNEGNQGRILVACLR